jgi:hypothetical protein
LFFSQKRQYSMPGGIQSKKGPAGTAKNARFSRIFSDLGSRQSLLIYITQQDDRHRVAETLIARSCPSKLGRDTRS